MLRGLVWRPNLRDNLRHTMKKLRSFLRLFAVLPLLLTFGCGKGHLPAEEEERPAPVKVALAEKKSFGEWTELVGTTMLLPGRGAIISTLVEGRVEWLLGKAAADNRRLDNTGQ